MGSQLTTPHQAFIIKEGENVSPTRKAFLKSVFLAICSLALFQFSSALGADQFQFVGSWKLNVAKSTNTPGLPAKVIIEQQGDTAVVTLKNDAGVTLRKYSYPLKGGPMTNLEGNRPSNVSEFKTVVSDRIMDETVMRDGKPVGNGRYIVEESGKVLTYRRRGTDIQGKPYESTAVYERQ
jgi:hypothetical protein